MSQKIFGVGLTNALLLAIFTMLCIVGFKVVFNKYQVKGLTDTVNAI